jgi:hypothetical protein
MGNKFGDTIVIVMLLLMITTYILYVLYPDPAASPTMSLIINGSIGAMLILSIVVYGMIMRNPDLGTHN